MRLIEVRPNVAARVGDKLYCLACGLKLAAGMLVYAKPHGRKTTYLCQDCGDKPKLVYQMRRNHRRETVKKSRAYFLDDFKGLRE